MTQELIVRRANKLRVGDTIQVGYKDGYKPVLAPVDKVADVFTPDGTAVYVEYVSPDTGKLVGVLFGLTVGVAATKRVQS